MFILEVQYSQNLLSLIIINQIAMKKKSKISDDSLQQNLNICQQSNQTVFPEQEQSLSQSNPFPGNFSDSPKTLSQTQFFDNQVRNQDIDYTFHNNADRDIITALYASIKKQQPQVAKSVQRQVLNYFFKDNELTHHKIPKTTLALGVTFHILKLMHLQPVEYLIKSQIFLFKPKKIQDWPEGKLIFYKRAFNIKIKLATFISEEAIGDISKVVRHHKKKI